MWPATNWCSTPAYWACSFLSSAGSALVSLLSSLLAIAAAGGSLGTCATLGLASADGALAGLPWTLSQNRSVLSTRPSPPPSLPQLLRVSALLAATRSPNASPQVAGHFVLSVPCVS